MFGHGAAKLNIQNIGQAGASMLQRAAQLNQPACDKDSFRPAEPHDANPASARRRRDGGDGFAGRGNGSCGIARHSFIVGNRKPKQGKWRVSDFENVS